MYNGLADAIWVGSKHKPEARKWVSFLGSPGLPEHRRHRGRRVPGDPVRGPEGGRQAQGRTGIDVSAFTSYIESGNTVLYPITDKAPQINLIVQPTLEEFLNGDEDAAKVFKDMNDQVNNQLEFAATSDARRSSPTSRP